MKLFTVPALVLAAAVTASAQQKVEQRRPAPRDGVVEIETAGGSLRVIGWDREEVEVRGTLGQRAEGLEFESGERRTRIEVETRRGSRSVEANLEVRVPAGSRLEIESFAASIHVSGVQGGILAESVNGNIELSGESQEIEASSVNGTVEISCGCARVRAETVNGKLNVRSGTGDVEASTVNGTLTVGGGPFRRVELETVNGRVLFDGALDPRARLELESVSGDIELQLPAGLSAEIEVSSFSGDILNQLTDAAAHRASRWTSEKELRLSTGSGGATISVSTLSGDVVLKKR